MTITFDNGGNMTYILRNIGGTYDTTNYGASSAFDLFDDSSVVGDYIIFSPGRYSMPWHNLYFDIGTALSATSITVVWEYYKQGAGWTAIPGVTDNTNAFQNTGTNSVLFDVPEYMCVNTLNYAAAITVGTTRYYGNWIKCRITAISGITEGGRTQNTRITNNDWMIKAYTTEVITLEIQASVLAMVNIALRMVTNEGLTQ